MAGKVNLEDVQRYREENKHDNQGLFTFDEGDTVIYVCQPCDDDATLPQVDLKQHKVSQDKRPIVCLDLDKNPVLSHPRVVAYLEEDGKDIDGGCPVCEAIAAGTFEGEAKKAKAKTTSLWNFVTLKYRKDARMPWQDLAFEVRQCSASYTVSDGILEMLGNEGDITDPEKAIFARVNRKGSGKMDTEYKVHADSETLRKPVRLSAGQRKIIDEALAPGGNGDLYRIVAAFTQSREEVIAALGGLEEEETKPAKKGKAPVSSKGPAPSKAAPKGKAKPEHFAASTQEDDPPPCYEVDCTPSDSECQACAFKEPCAEACGVEVPPERLAAKTGNAKPATKVPQKAAAAPKASTPAKAPQKPKKAAEPEPEPEEEPEEEPEDDEEEAEEQPETDGEAAETEFIAVSEAEVDGYYLLPNGMVGKFKGTSKNKGFFETDDAKRVVLDIKELVAPHAAGEAEEEPGMPEEEAEPAEEDSTLDEMEKMLAQKKQKMGAGAKNGKASARA